MADQALATVAQWLAWAVTFVFWLFGALEGAMRQLLGQLHIRGPLASVILLLTAVALIVVAVRVFGGVLRLLLIAFLVLLLWHLLTHGWL